MQPYYSESGINIYHGSAASLPLADRTVQTCVTSPPYFGLRDYGVEGQIGLEESPDAYVAALVKVFREVRRVLADDGTLWLNLGDSYCSTDKWGGGTNGNTGKHVVADDGEVPSWAVRSKKQPFPGVKPKDLLGIPWMVAFSLRADGWYLRSDIIWHKPNPMPESVTDRPTRAHEYIFLLSKSARYFYDAEAIKEPGSGMSGGACFGKVNKDGPGSRRISPEENARIRGTDKQRGHSRRHAGFNDRWDAMERSEQIGGKINKRDVWVVAPANYPAAHFATFPPNLIEPCIRAGSRPGDLVLDNFNGSGTTAMVARELGRRYAGMELNADYIELTKKRLAQQVLFGTEVAAY